MKLSVRLETVQPMELADFSVSLLALGAEYQRFAAREGAQDARLYVREMKAGSVIAELVPYVGQMAAVMPGIIDQGLKIVEFAKHLRAGYEWLLGRGEKPDLDQESLRNLSSIVEPIAKDRAGQINIAAINLHDSPITFNMTLSTIEASAAQNRVRDALSQPKLKTSGLHEGAVLYWDQAKHGLDNKSGDKGVIERIYEGPVKVRFARDDLKLAMLYAPAHPFERGFVVDVMVDTVNDRPILYTVLELREILDRDTPTSPTD